MGSRWRFGDYGIRGSAVDLLLFVYTHGVRGLLDLPLRYAVFISLRCNADIQAFSHGDEHHQVHHRARVQILSWVVKKGEEEGRKKDEVHIAERSFL